MAPTGCVGGRVVMGAGNLVPRIRGTGRPAGRALRMVGYPTVPVFHVRGTAGVRARWTSRMTGVFWDLVSRVWDTGLVAPGGTSRMAG